MKYMEFISINIMIIQKHYKFEFHIWSVYNTTVTKYFKNNLINASFIFHTRLLILVLRAFAYAQGKYKKQFLPI